jgi:HAD superfamily hydrolase (TIGR01509 family)
MPWQGVGLDWHWDIQRYGELLRVSGGRERILHFVETHAPQIARARRDALARQLHTRKTGHYLRTIAAGAVRLRPGVFRLLNEARRVGLQLAIATTTTRANVDSLLAHTLPPGALQWFDAIGAAEDAPHKKPDPQVYNVVLDRLRLPPQACLAFEDANAVLRAASATGLRTIITVNDYTANQDFDSALTVLSDFGEPGHRARVLAGAPLRRELVDVEQLRDWHAAR